MYEYCFQTSSMLHSIPCNPWRIWLVFFWNFLEPELILKPNMLKQKRPRGVMNVVSGLDSHASFICQNPEFASSFENTLEPANLLRVVSTAGSGWFSLLTYSFNLLRSTQTLTLPIRFGGYHHGSAPISGLANSGYDTCLQHPVQLFFSLLIQGQGYLPWNWHLEKSGILFESDTVTVLHDTGSFEQLRVLVCYFTLVVITAQAVKSAYSFRSSAGFLPSKGHSKFSIAYICSLASLTCTYNSAMKVPRQLSFCLHGPMRWSC